MPLGFVWESWVLKKVLKFAQLFSRTGKSLENRGKVRKMVIFIFIRGILLNQSFFFLFQSSNNCLTSYFLSFWSNLIQSRAYIAVHREKSFVPMFFEVCIDSLFDNLGSRKKLFFLLLLFSVRTPCLVGQSWSLCRTERIRLEIIMSIEKNRFNYFYIGAQSCFHVFVSHSLQTLQVIILSHYLVRINRLPFALFYAYLWNQSLISHM